MGKEIEIAKKIKSELDSLPLFQEFNKLKEQINSNEELVNLRKEIKGAIKDKTKREELLASYNSHPLVVNFKAIEEEVKDYLKEITDIINKK